MKSYEVNQLVELLKKSLRLHSKMWYVYLPAPLKLEGYTAI